MADIALHDVTKRYPDGTEAVKHLNLEIADGEFMILVGPSGCGKSTALRMIAGLEDISEGTLEIGGEVVNDRAPRDRDIAMVFQNYALYPHLTVFDNMAFGLKLRKHAKEDIRERVTEAAQILGLEDILASRPKELSGGQRQRVAVGRAIVRQPKVFLFDEPLSNLDAKLRVQMRAEIRALHQRLDATMLYVTHDQVEAMTMGDRIAVMRAGVIEQLDTPLNLYDFPVNRFVAGFIGSPAMNFFEGSLVGSSFREGEGGAVVSLTEAQVSNLAAGSGSVVLGVRPEDVYEVGAGAAAPAGAVRSVTVAPTLIEQMGSEVMLHASTPTGPMVARVARRPVLEPGESVDLAFDRAKLHFFDGVTGVRIPTGG